MGERVALMLESDGPGGAESVLLSLATGLRERGIEVHAAVLANRSGWLTSRLRDAGIDLFTPSLKHPVSLKFAKEVGAWMRDSGSEIVHAHEFTMGFYAGVASLFTDLPYVITMHGGHGYSHAFRRRLALGMSARRAAAVVGVSESTCEHLVRSLWMNRNRVQLVTNGVLAVVGNRQSTRTSLALRENEHLFLAVGNLYAVKGHKVLLEACALLAKKKTLSPWRVVVAGRGNQAEALQQQIVDMELEEHVVLLGLRNDIGDLLAAADGWVMPSLSEGLPLALLEAMFCGLPVISTAVGGIPDLIRPGESGWLVEPGNARELADAMMEQLSDRPLGARMAARAKLVAEQGYGQEMMIDRYLGIYRAALAARALTR
jgi:glycosyltransferase involved in cell wall biosynthesis